MYKPRTDQLLPFKNKLGSDLCLPRQRKRHQPCDFLISSTRSYPLSSPRPPCNQWNLSLSPFFYLPLLPLSSPFPHFSSIHEIQCYVKFFEGEREEGRQGQDHFAERERVREEKAGTCAYCSQLSSRNAFGLVSFSLEGVSLPEIEKPKR